MVQRDTTTGGVLEAMIIPALRRGGYHYRKGVYINHRPGSNRHKVDVVAWLGKNPILISLKWQQVPGTTEQKIPFEVICLAEALRKWIGGKRKKISCQEPNCPKKGELILHTGKPSAYLVLGGLGWSLREFYVSGGLKKYLRNAHGVKIITLEDFVALANKRKL